MTKSRIRKNIKANAKTMLSDSWGTAIGILLLNFVIVLGISMLVNAGMIASIFNADLPYSYNPYDLDALPQAMELMELQQLSGIFSSNFIISIALSLLTIPLSFGVMGWYVSLSDGKKKPFYMMFQWYSSAGRFWKSIWMNINIYLRLLGWNILIFFPFLLIVGFAGGFFASYLYETSFFPFIVLIVALSAGLLVLLISISLRYAMAYYLLVRFPEESVKKLIKESIALMKGHRGELFVFALSFIGWYLLALPTFGLISLFLAPYFTGASMIFFNYVFETGKKNNVGSYDLRLPPVSPEGPQAPAATDSGVTDFEGFRRSENNPGPDGRPTE